MRTDLRQEIIRGFGAALDHRFPVAKMKNPNVYGGNDPKQMAANNTSGFNCRKVVGNPYKMSPHSYGIAIDVNTVQNPYRDARGTWWPSSGSWRASAGPGSCRRAPCTWSPTRRSRTGRSPPTRCCAAETVGGRAYGSTMVTVEAQRPEEQA